MSVTRDEIFQNARVRIDHGTLFGNYRVETRVKQLELMNGARIRMKQNLMWVAELSVEGEKVPDGVYENEPWIENFHNRARVIVGPFDFGEEKVAANVETKD